jgi:hypothetical protein
MSICSLILCLSLLADEPPRQFRHWIGGKDAGRLEAAFSESRVITNNRLRIERGGGLLEQNLTQEISRNDDGEITASWTLGLSKELQHGRAKWSPTEPKILRLSSPGKKNDVLIPIGQDVLLWPPDIDKKMRSAARGLSPIRIVSFSFPSSSVSHTELMPECHDPLVGFPDAVRYSGTAKEGGSVSQITSWICPSAGQIKQISSNSGLIIITQRGELGRPAESLGPGLFEWTLRKLPHIPFLAWRNEVRISGLPNVAESLQQKKVGAGEYLLSRAPLPDDDETRQLPVRNNNPDEAEDPQYLADSPLLGLNDAAINGLAVRLNPKQGATRWELACQVTGFVFYLIRDKSLEVGFASAPEVAKNLKGDCTEHTVLMIALLRRLGVPARAAFGWAGLDDGREASLGLHAWAEVKIGKRWIPMDPTFNQAPAGACRVATSTSNLNSVAELGWDLGLALGSALNIVTAPIMIEGNLLIIDDISVRSENGSWKYANGRLCLEHPRYGQVFVSGNVPSLTARDAKFVHTPNNPAARYTNSQRQLAIDCGKNRWLYFEGLDERSALAILRGLVITAGRE